LIKNLKDKWLDYKDYGFVCFKELDKQGKVTLIDKNDNILQEVINVITLSQH